MAIPLSGTVLMVLTNDIIDFQALWTFRLFVLSLIFPAVLNSDLNLALDSHKLVSLDTKYVTRLVCLPLVSFIL